MKTGSVPSGRQRDLCADLAGSPISQWYNSNYSHEGTLWSGRFKSVLVEDGRYLNNLAYIHGNPIRAGIVTRAADYEWSAPGAAAKGDARAKKGLSLQEF